MTDLAAWGTLTGVKTGTLKGFPHPPATDSKPPQVGGPPWGPRAGQAQPPPRDRQEQTKMAAPTVRRADFLMALAYATDLATGHSRDFDLRSCVLAMRMADGASVDENMRRAVYHQALLRYIGCNADTHLLAAAWGDEIALRRDLHRIDMGDRAAFVGVFVQAITRMLPGATPEELAEAVQRGLAE